MVRATATQGRAIVAELDARELALLRREPVEPMDAVVGGAEARDDHDDDGDGDDGGDEDEVA